MIRKLPPHSLSLILMRRLVLGVLNSLFTLLITSGVQAQTDSSLVIEPVEHVYASPGGVELKAHVFSIEKGKADSQRPAIILFHGGGWAEGGPEWAFPRAKHYARLGMVAVAAQYRLSDQKEITPLEAMDDSRSVIRWMRRHSDSLGIDPEHIVAFGWSAGAHLAMCAAMFDSSDSISAAPNALVLVSPAVSLASDGWVQRLLGQRADARDISPDEHVRGKLPPALVLVGSVDTVTPLSGVKRFCDRMVAAGNDCRLHVYEGYGHLFTPKGIPDDGMPQPDPTISADARARADQFLKSLGFLK